MIQIELSQPSTWRGVFMAMAGLSGLWYIAPEISALSKAATPEQVQFFLGKATALATAIGLAGQTASGMIGIIFSDNRD
jgi:hypothetical protein